MAESALQAVNVAMRGGGYYSRANQSAKDVIDSATPLVLDAIRRILDTDPSTPFTLTDMGCADGGTSLDMMGQVLAAVHARWPRRPICVVYTDTPRNDYNSLFHILHGLTSLPTYLDEVEDVHVLASATSFYRQILPAGMLHLGFSASAMHWLSHKPCDITDHVHAVGASGAELTAFAEQGRRDWETILLQRAHELVPGGRLALVNCCQDEAGRYGARLPPRSASMVTRRALPVHTSRRCGRGVRARFWPRSRQIGLQKNAKRSSSAITVPTKRWCARILRTTARTSSIST
jgi:hypothetical protein